MNRLQDELRAVRDAHRGAEQALAQLRRAFQEQVGRAPAAAERFRSGALLVVCGQGSLSGVLQGQI